MSHSDQQRHAHTPCLRLREKTENEGGALPLPKLGDELLPLAQDSGEPFTFGVAYDVRKTQPIGQMLELKPEENLVARRARGQRVTALLLYRFLAKETGRAT
jgi:hypothetical protein